MEFNDSRSKQRYRKIIVDNAFRLFNDKGIGETTILNIANRSNVGRKTIYNYFASKEMIAEYIYERVILKIIIKLMEGLDPLDGQTAFDIISRFIKLGINNLMHLKKEVSYTVHYDYYFKGKSNVKYVMKALDNETMHKWDAFMQDKTYDNTVDFKGYSPRTYISLLGQIMMAVTTRLIFREQMIEGQIGVKMKDAYAFADMLIDGLKPCD